MHFKASRFFLATHGLTWLFWIPFAALQWSAGQFPHNLLFAAGGLGPLIATIIMVRSGGDRTYVREYLARISSPRRASVPWWCVVLFLPAVVTILGILLGALFTGTHIERTGLLNTDTVASMTVF